MGTRDTALWSAAAADVYAVVGSRAEGLSSDEVEARAGGRGVHAPGRMSAWRLGLRQIENPIVQLLIAATALSMSLGDVIDGTIIFVITAASALLGFTQEHGAVRVVEDLLSSVRVRVTVRRDGAATEVGLDDVVVGDVLLLRTGDVVAADARVVEVDRLVVDESPLTGESFPVDKRPGVSDAVAPPGSRANAVFCGTHVVSGSGVALVGAVGVDTEFGKVGADLARGHVPTAFEQGLRRFGFLLMRTAGVMVFAVFVANVVLDRPVVESVLFSLALAVGLTPQLLPTIVTVTLAHGAREMARRNVVVKRLDAIEDIGAIDVLCTDKTGTLTQGSIRLDAALDQVGQRSERVRELGWINATVQRGFSNPIDMALATTAAPMRAWTLIDELPYDFDRRLLSVLVTDGEETLLITKGAVDAVIGRCAADADETARLRARFEQLSAEGSRVLAVATRGWGGDRGRSLSISDENELKFEGFLCFTDPPKADAADAIARLTRLGVATKLITGDNRYAATFAARSVGLDAASVVTGDQLTELTDEDLADLVDHTDVFAEIAPLQKESIVYALRRHGHTVGYLGDGINDAPSLRIADVGISVDTAVDVAKHTASVVLLDKDLSVLAEGIRQGRGVFANTLKYVRVTISANFGNMISMAAAAAVLPFLPLLPRQILLLNFLSDIPAMTIAADRVDPEAVAEPHGWDLRQLRSFMITFGLVSSVFDITTFVVLRAGFNADAGLFQTGWFIESTATELAVMLVLRTWRPSWRSRPGTALMVSSAVVAVTTITLPFSPLAVDLGLVRPDAGVLVALAIITAAYIATSEIAKRYLTEQHSDPHMPHGI